MRKLKSFTSGSSPFGIGSFARFVLIVILAFEGFFCRRSNCLYRLLLVLFELIEILSSVFNKSFLASSFDWSMAVIIAVLLLYSRSNLFNISFILLALPWLFVFCIELVETDDNDKRWSAVFTADAEAPAGMCWFADRILFVSLIVLIVELMDSWAGEVSRLSSDFETPSLIISSFFSFWFATCFGFSFDSFNIFVSSSNFL